MTCVAVTWKKRGLGFKLREESKQELGLDWRGGLGGMGSYAFRHGGEIQL